MYRFTPALKKTGGRGFTLVEALVAAVIALYVITGAISSYVMLWTWWYETQPEVEAQRLARIAISSIVYGRIDPTTGSYSIGPTTYTRRNGIAQATRVPGFPSAQSITFGLEPDSSNVRSYYLGVDPISGLNAVYYQNSSGVSSMIGATAGITDLTFEKFNGADNMITVTATVDRDIIGTGATPRHIHVSYVQPILLKNVQ